MEVDSKHITLEGLHPKTSVPKLIFHLLENTRLKKHQIGRIQKFQQKFVVEIIEQDQEDLEQILWDLDGCEIDSHLITVWSADLEVDQTIVNHFKKLEKWQMMEMEENQKETILTPFHKIRLIDYEPSIQNSWILEFELLKPLQNLDKSPKPGQPLILENTNDPKEKVYAIVIKWHTDTCKLNIDQAPSIDDWEGSQWNISHNNNHVGMERGLQQMQRLPFQLNQITNQLFDVTILKQKPNDETVSVSPSKSQDLNEQQNEAYMTCLIKPGLHLIQGPPGTGKSKVLLELMKAFHRDEKRVLVAASTHAALDHLLAHCELPEAQLLRLGHPTRISSRNLNYHLEKKWSKSESYQIHKKLQKDHREVKRQFLKSKGEDKKITLQELKMIEKTMQELLLKGRQTLLEQSSFVFTTHTGFQPQLLKGHKFDVVLIDEAAQCSEIDIWLTLPYASKWILAGDPCQLPTLVKSPKAKELSISLMERLISQGHPHYLLEQQYRMHESIAEYCSGVFYQNKLKAAEAHQNERLIFPQVTEDLFWVDHPQIFIDTAGSDSSEQLEGHSWLNTFEADFVFRRVRECLSAGIDPDDIGIISPYSSQTDYLKSRFDRDAPEISSVDSFQGREKKVIFISCVRSNHEGQIGFLSDTRRMNVAMTRAQKLCVIVGDSATLASHPFYADYFEYKENTAGLHSVWEWSE